MMLKALVSMLSCSFTCLAVQAATPRVVPDGELPKDARLGTLRHLSHDYFPFQKVSSPDEWEKRAAALQRQVKVANGIWPLPTRTPLNAMVHSPVERDDYTVWRVYLESFPGHFVTGSLYRPKHVAGRMPAVLSPHGHWPEGRFHGFDDDELKSQVAIGAERFLEGGRHPVQARCVQLARMGCLVFQYDMDGYADSVQRQSHHGKREQSDTVTSWGINSPQAGLHLQNLMGLQTWNSIRALDFLTSLEDVDPKRVVVTGSSGGGTQTFILMAVDERPAAAIPCVMVSTAMQGGCFCENAPYLRIGAGNIDLAALAAPRPLALTAADDWTVELETKGFPDLLALYDMVGKKDDCRAVFHTQFKHNYNSVNRMFMYGCVNDFLGLGFEKPILEEDFVPLTRIEQSVWTDSHPKPSGVGVGESHERAMLRWWAEDAEGQLAELRDDSAAYQKVVGGAWDVMIGRRLDDVGEMDGDVVERRNFGDYRGATILLEDGDTQSQLPAIVLAPSEESNNSQVVLWLSDEGKSGLVDEEGSPNSDVRSLLDAGFVVVGVDLLYQGEFLLDGKPLTSARLNPLDPSQADKNREPWDFMHGYNWPLFSQRVHDVLSTIRAIQLGPLQASEIHLVGQGSEVGAIALAAAVQSGDALEKTAIATEGFRFTAIDRKDDPMFLPGAVKYDGVEGLKRLLGEGLLWFNDQESADAGEIVTWLKE